MDPELRRLCQQLACLDRLEKTPGANDQLRRCLLELALRVEPSIRAWVYARRLMIFAGVTSLLTGLLYGLTKARDPKLDDVGKLDFNANRHWLLGTPVLILTSVVIFLAAQLVNNYIWLACVRAKRRLRDQLPQLMITQQQQPLQQQVQQQHELEVPLCSQDNSDSVNNKEVYL